MKIIAKVDGLDSVIQKLKKIEKTIDSAKQKTLEEAPKQIKVVMNMQCFVAIMTWYKTYDPYVYQRTWGLKTVYRITSGIGEVRLELRPDLIGGSHEVPNDYLYQLTIVEGYHGGAKSGEGHPNPGRPYYYNDVNNHWLDPAVQTFSPLRQIITGISGSNYSDIVGTIFKKHFRF